MNTLITLLLLAPSAMAGDMQINRDIAYVASGHPRQKLDVFAPTNGKALPIVVWIHGGGWRRGDKSAVQRKPQALVDRGFVFVSVNYRFVPQVTVQEMTGDIAAAIKWVHGHAEQYGGSPDNIFVAGHSAGAHLAALVCTDARYLQAQGLSLSNIKGCIPVDTAMFDIPRQVGGRGQWRSQLYGPAFGTDKQSQQELSPIRHVVANKNIPPFLILHVASRLDSGTQSREFARTLRSAGIDAHAVACQGKDHATINRELGQPDDPPTRALVAFLDGVLKARQ